MFPYERVREDPLPSYSTLRSSDSDDSPEYSLSSYRIGSEVLRSPLVTVEQLKAHLSLLRAFRTIKTTIEDGTHPCIPDDARSLDPSDRWRWFVDLAIDRFQLWLPAIVKKNIDNWVQTCLPPIDVLVIWHAYLLNPSCYAEDVSRLFLLKRLGSISGYLLDSLVFVGDIFSYEASEERKESWFEQTDTPFDYLDAAAFMSHHDVDCPHCFIHIAVPYLTDDGTGYSQDQFSAECPSCEFEITKESLAVLKFACDVVLEPGNIVDKPRGKGVYLPGTLRTSTRACNEEMGKSVQSAAKKVFELKDTAYQFNKADWAHQVFERTGHSMDIVRKAVCEICDSRTFSHSTLKASKILDAYTNDRPFSFDLAKAVIRQGPFVDKMYLLGWISPGSFDDEEDQVVLEHAITRYHAFLDLIASNPTDSVVPTLDIDLVWHTHQMSRNYDDHCMQYIKKYLDHDVEVEETALAASYDSTCVAWQKRFGVSYTFCGCPLPYDTQADEGRFSRLKRRLKGSNAPSSDLIPPAREDALLATHVSDHNSAETAPPAAYRTQRAQREEQVQQWRERDEQYAREGKMDMDLIRRGETHRPAFLSPV